MRAVAPMHVTFVGGREAGFGVQVAVAVKGRGGGVEGGVVVDGRGGDADDGVGGDGGAVVESEVVADVAAECHCRLGDLYQSTEQILRYYIWGDENGSRTY